MAVEHRTSGNRKRWQGIQQGALLASTVGQGKAPVGGATGTDSTFALAMRSSGEIGKVEAASMASSSRKSLYTVPV
eukprot:7567223-Pyramimonas_sp.AAC.2